MLMFDTSDKPRVFGVPLGVDFPAAMVRGLEMRQQDQTPEQVARTQLILNTQRMKRRVRDLFDAGPARLLPRLQLVTDLALGAGLTDIPTAVPPLRRRLEISQLVSILLEREPDLAPRSSLYDLADSLAALLDEMHGEGVNPEVIRALDVSDESGHWGRSLQFLGIVQHYFDQAHESPDKETRQRMVVQGLSEIWAQAPPQHPVLIAGSTGSRGSTMMLMKAIAKLPQGAIILPGFDFDLPTEAWEDLADPLTSEDHPQYRFHKLLAELGMTPAAVVQWDDSQPNCPARSALLSLALRPAPVTDRWLTEGP